MKLPSGGGGIMGGLVVVFLLVLLVVLIIVAIAIWQLVSGVQDLLSSCAVPTGGGTVLMLTALEIAKVRVGRPPVPLETRARVRELRRMGLGYKRIALETGLGRTTVRRILRETWPRKGGHYSTETRERITTPTTGESQEDP